MLRTDDIPFSILPFDNDIRLNAMSDTVERMLREYGKNTDVCFRVVTRNGRAYQNQDGNPHVTLIFKNRQAETRVALFGHIGMLESYFDQSLDIEGDLRMLFRAGMDTGFDDRPNPLIAIRNRWHEFRFSNRTVAQAKANAEFHYNVGTEFYRYWLDNPYMMYTCAYWKEGTETLEQAQQNKIEHVCRKLRLQPGDDVVDLGCGWGGFLFYANERYGTVGTGINTATEQVVNMQKEIERRNLQDKIKVIEADYREVSGQFDKVCSIGSLEHAGRDQLDEVVKAHADWLKPGGIGLLHFIGHVNHYQTEFYIRKHIFPGGWIPSLSQTINAMERAGLEILDIENLRRHYALTLDCWAERFDRQWEKIRELNPKVFTEHFRRNWRTYLLSCAEMFRSKKGRTHLFQIAFSKGNAGYDYPMSRAHLYRQG